MADTEKYINHLSFRIICLKRGVRGDQNDSQCDLKRAGDAINQRKESKTPTARHNKLCLPSMLEGHITAIIDYCLYHSYSVSGEIFG